MKAKLVGIDLAKSVFQVCVIALSGSVLFNKKFTRAKFLEWLKDLEPTTVAMESCATGHFWGRKLQAAGHTVKLVRVRVPIRFSTEEQVHRRRQQRKRT